VNAIRTLFCRERRRPGGLFTAHTNVAGFETLHKNRRDAGAPGAEGFTLLEVMVSLTVLAIGAALALSLISGALSNIRKVQLRTRTVEHAEAVMELTLLDDSIRKPTTLTGDFEDGTRWSVRVEDYTLPTADPLQPTLQPPGTAAQNMPVKLLCYTVEMFSPDSRGSDYQLQTIKMVKKLPEDQLTRTK
jgi:prepilin-type N-terminal cleavage/methylation domain-containing protein